MILDLFLYDVLGKDDPVLKFCQFDKDLQTEIFRNGRFLQLTKNFLTGYKGENIGFLLLVNDITELQRKESELRESEGKFKLLIENAPDLIWKIDENGFLSYVSPSWQRILGYPVSSVTGKKIQNFIHPDDIHSYENYLNSSITGNEKEPAIEYRVIYVDGTWHWHTGTMRIVMSQKESSITLIGVSRDITEKKISEAALKKANRQLNLLTSITRHDILNVISAMLGYLYLAKNIEKLPELEKILSKFEHMVPLIQEQIEFTRLYEELGNHEPKWQNINSLISKKEIPTLPEFYSSCQVFEIFADPMLKQAIFNLIDNSVRHGERVTSISITCEEKDEGLFIIYSDNGIGVELNEKVKIFERGYGKNTGLGLFLVKEILLLTGITITENGEQGNGARFEIFVQHGLYRKII